jgi:leader peptidase (prepilin peptidase)/N-methyltransferase
MQSFRLFLLELRELSTDRSRQAAVFLLVLGWAMCISLQLPVFPFMLLLPLLAISAVTDLFCMFIPNWLTVTSCSGAVLLAAWSGGMSGLTAGIAGGGLLFAFTVSLYGLRQMGAGDVKLAACLGCCVGLEQGLWLLGWTYVLAGVAAWIRLQARPYIVTSVRPSMPMAPWFALGTLVSFLQGTVQ